MSGIKEWRLPVDEKRNRSMEEIIRKDKMEKKAAKGVLTKAIYAQVTDRQYKKLKKYLAEHDKSIHKWVTEKIEGL